MKKRVLSILLCVIMFCGLLSTAALATTDSGGGGNGGENTNPGGEDSGQTTSTAEISLGPQEGASLTVNDDGIITFTDSESVSIGTVQVYMGNSTDAYTEYLPTELPEARLAIPEGTETVKIVLKPEGDLEAQLSYGGNIREAGAISDPVINEGTYTYTIIVENIPKDDSGSKFVGITVEFGTNPGGGGEDFTAVIWNGPQVEHESLNGTISVASIEVGNNKYTYDSTNNVFVNAADDGLFLEFYRDSNGEYGVRVGDAAFERDPYFRYYSNDGNGEALHPGEYDKVEELENYDPWVYINFVFKPDYGYQVAGVGTNGEPTSLADAGLTAAEAISTFRFPVYYHNNPHFVVVFSESDHVIAENSSKVNSAAIDDGENKIADSGNLKLNVTDLSGNDLKDAEAFAGQLGASEAAENIMYLDVDLYQIVSKSNNDAIDMYWETPLTDLGDNTVSITLNVGADPNATYYVIREHEDKTGTVTYTRVQTTNNGDGTISFTTNQFSTYAIGYTPGNDGEDESCPMTAYTDLNPKAWYHDGVHFCIENSLMLGIGNDLFNPNGTTSRAMAVTILWRLEGKPIVSHTMDFADVEQGKWYTEAIRWANKNDIVKGYDNGKFGTNDAITREQMATILYRYTQYKAEGTPLEGSISLSNFADGAAVSSWAVPAMEWACGNDIIQGIPKDNTTLLKPKNNTTRAETATLIQRY